MNWRKILIWLAVAWLAVAVIAFVSQRLISEDDDGAGTTCADYTFDRASWDSRRSEQLAEARSLARCDTLDGLTGAEVRNRLGDPGAGPGYGPDEWHYTLGIVRSGPGFGDDRALVVRFGSGGEVEGARVVTGGG
jgi:hypothetical protein